MIHLGEYQQLVIIKKVEFGVYLTTEELAREKEIPQEFRILLPKKYVPQDSQIGDKLEVFIGPPLVDSFMKYYNLTEEQAKEEVLEEVFRRWNHLEKNEICLIGDTLFDVNGAKCAGIPCVAVSYGFGDVEEMKNAGAVAIIDDLMELPRVLKGIEL